MNGWRIMRFVRHWRKNGKFVTSVYRKPTFSWVFTNYESFIPTYQKRGLLHTLLHRSFSICCDFKIFHFEIDHLKTIHIKNNYPLNFIDWYVKSFLNCFESILCLIEYLNTFVSITQPIIVPLSKTFHSVFFNVGIRKPAMLKFKSFNFSFTIPQLLIFVWPWIILV